MVDPVHSPERSLVATNVRSGAINLHFRSKGPHQGGTRGR
jgi:hypothetical protein